MNLADRIQSLRKTRGISQEELADRLGVSRQAVSKWESEQSMPDLNKIILLSDFFEVTTDYLLKGIEPAPQEEKNTADARMFQMIATAFNTIGLFVSAAVWYEEQQPMALVIWLIFLIVGVMVFGIGCLYSEPDSVRCARRSFWRLNIWLITFIPLSAVYNIFVSGILAPYPLMGHPLYALAVFWAVYVILCTAVTVKMR